MRDLLNAIEMAQIEACYKFSELGPEARYERGVYAEAYAKLNSHYGAQIASCVHQIEAQAKRLKTNQTPFVRGELDYACNLLNKAVQTYEHTNEFDKAKEILLRYS